MKKALRAAGYILVLMLSYVVFQGFFTFMAMLVAMLYAAVKGYVSVESIGELDNFEALLSSSANGAYIWAMAIGLFLSTISMLFFLYIINTIRKEIANIKLDSNRTIKFSVVK